MKCIVCGSEVEEFDKDGKEYYRCAEGHERARMIENSGLQYYRNRGEVVHKSVGAILLSGNEIVLLKRKKYPFKYTIPAGHLEKGEEPKDAVLREVEEETGLNIEKAEKIFEGEIKDPCRRGADRHHWSLFEARVPENADFSLNDEASSYRMEPPEKLESLDLTLPTHTLLFEKGLV